MSCGFGLKTLGFKGIVHVKKKKWKNVSYPILSGVISSEYGMGSIFFQLGVKTFLEGIWMSRGDHQLSPHRRDSIVSWLSPVKNRSIRKVDLENNSNVSPQHSRWGKMILKRLAFSGWKQWAMTHSTKDLSIKPPRRNATTETLNNHTSTVPTAIRVFRFFILLCSSAGWRWWMSIKPMTEKRSIEVALCLLSCQSVEVCTLLPTEAPFHQSSPQFRAVLNSVVRSTSPAARKKLVKKRAKCRRQTDIFPPG